MVFQEQWVHIDMQEIRKEKFNICIEYAGRDFSCTFIFLFSMLNTMSYRGGIYLGKL